MQAFDLALRLVLRLIRLTKLSKNTNLTCLSCKMQLEIRLTHAIWNDSKVRHLEFPRYQYYALTPCIFREIFFVLAGRVCDGVKYWSCHEQLEVHNEHYAGFKRSLKKQLSLPCQETCWSKCNNKQLFTLRNKRGGEES